MRPTLMGFLDRPNGVIDGVIGLGVRLALLCTGAMALRTYTALVRGEERPILDPHPADVPALVRYLLRRVAWEGLIWPLGVAALCWPLWAAGPEIYLTAVGLAAGGWGAGLLLGFPVHLGAVWAAESPGLAGLFNLIRGQNPQLQAALLYAPGVALALGALGIGAAAAGARLGLNGAAWGWLLLLTPWLMGALAFWLTPARAERPYYRATLLLAEVDGALAAREDPEEARSVYLEWAIRFAPAALRPFLRQDLRHGWRAHRGWVTGAWGLGLVALAPAWSDAADAGTRAALIAGGALALIGALGQRLGVSDPAWLDAWLAPPPLPRLIARGLTLWAYLQGVVIPPTLALAVRQGGDAALGFALPVELLAVGLAITGAIAGRLRGAGLAPYLVVAALAWAGLSWGMLTGGAK
ncbi:hypothetical protein L6R49_02030 [Myxococcota bacterium]|nr:hypothetical protein [Myxococcota bacterium]